MPQARSVRLQRLAEAVALMEIAHGALNAVDLRMTSPDVRAHVQAARQAAQASSREIARALEREDVRDFMLEGVPVDIEELVSPHLTMDDFVARAVRALGAPRPHHVAAYTDALRKMRVQLLLDGPSVAAGDELPTNGCPK